VIATNTNIILDEVTPLLARVNDAAVAKGLVLVGARAVGSLVKEHLYGLDQQRHRYGRHFYRQAADSVTAQSVAQGASVSITQLGFRQRLLGGAIYPRGGFLTIPEAPEAYGHRAREFPDLHVARVVDPKFGFLRWALIRNLSTPIAVRKRKQKDGTYRTKIIAGQQRGGEVMYWLVRDVGQRADPTVLPYAEQMNARAVSAIETEMLRLARGKTGGYQS